MSLFSGKGPKTQTNPLQSPPVDKVAASALKLALNPNSEENEHNGLPGQTEEPATLQLLV